MKKNKVALLALLALCISGCDQMANSASGSSNVSTMDSSSNSIDSSSTSSNQESNSEANQDELKAMSIQEFISKKDENQYYLLTGTVTKITSSTYGNFYLKDSSGEIFVYGLLVSKDSTDKKAFASLDIQEGDLVTIAGHYFNYNGKPEVLDGYFISKVTTPGGDDKSYIYQDFEEDEKKAYQDLFGFVIPFMPTDFYYTESYDEDGYKGIIYWTCENTVEDFTAYLKKFSSFSYDDQIVDEDGDIVYWYSQGDTFIDICYFYSSEEQCYWMYVDTYFESESGGQTGEDVNLITNANKGLPTSINGVYSVDFTKAAYVKNVTEQASYLDGCPTTGSPKVLVIPVEFSDVTAASKGYTIEAIQNAFTGVSSTLDYYSIKEYFNLASYGNLDLDITVLDQWYRPAQPSSYYRNATISYDGYEYDCGEQLIIDELLQQLSQTMDLSSFDSDNNQFIDAIVLVNTLEIDTDENGSSFDWAFRFWNLYGDDNGDYYEYDSVSANDYLWASYQFLFETVSSDGQVSYDGTKPTNTYTFIHEFSHILGADDYYDTAYISSPMGGADVMDSYRGDHNPFTKFNYGWLTSSRLVVAEEEITLELEAFEENGDTIIIANNWDDDLGAYQEYYIVMYYTNTSLNAGDDNGYFGRDGIVVYHVNASLYTMEYDGELYYDIYNNNTDGSDEYGTEDNLIEFVKSVDDNFTYVVGDSLSQNIVDSQGNSISYIFTVDSLTDRTATLTFTKVK